MSAATSSEEQVVDEGGDRPLSLRAKVVMAVLAIAGSAYVVAGVVYAAGQTLALAGLTGIPYYMGYGAQVFGWPLMMWVNR